MTIVRMACRAAAIAIAIAGVVDPAFSVTRPREAKITTVDLTLGGPIDHRVSCDPANPCVVIADGSKDAELPDDLTEPVSLERVEKSESPNIAIRTVYAGSSAHLNAAGVVRVALEGRGVAGRTTEIRVHDGPIVIGTAAVEWKADGTQTIDIPWWPLAAGARTLRVEAAAAAGEAVLFDNLVDVGADIGTEPVPVLFFDPRPSWNSTFVRRALEDDPRFLVQHHARVAPAISTGTLAGRFDAPTLNQTSLLVVGAPDALTAADVDLIDRFVRVRGGTAILLPERVPEGPTLRLFDGRWVEELIVEPRAVGPLRASELLRPRELRPLSVPIAPEIVATRAGAGRLIVSGAMDAWRHRDANAAAFDTFWRSLAAEGAAHGRRLRVEFEDAIARPGARHSFVVRYRSMEPESTLTANATARCSPVSADRTGTAQAIRLWPSGAAGTFSGEFAVNDSQTCTVEARVNDAQATAAVAVAASPAPIAHAVLENLERAVRLRAVGAPARPAETIRTTIHPMRSALWIIPFAGLLSIEWWLRRRARLR
jgi:hypothetical protein